MGDARKKSRKKRIGYNHLGMLGIALVVMVILGWLMMQSHTLEGRLSYYDAKAATLEQSIEDEKARTEEIDRRKEYMQTDEFAEEVARDKLGLVKDNEIVFKEKK